MVNTATSTSALQQKLAAPGWASVTGLVILANPRMIPASKTVVLDAQLYLKVTDQDLPLIGSLRYFNSESNYMTFDEGPNLYVIYTTVST
jgi:hypothetical protein